MSSNDRLKLPVLEDVYRNLFDLKLYRLLYAASQQVDDRPDYVFVGTHERWPVLVGTPPKRKPRGKRTPRDT